MRIFSLVMASLTYCGCLARRTRIGVANEAHGVLSAEANKSRSLRHLEYSHLLSQLLFSVHPPVASRQRQAPLSVRAPQARLDASRSPVPVPGALRRGSAVKAFVVEEPNVLTKGVVVPVPIDSARLNKAMASAKKDVDDILVREPDWNNYAPDVVLKDSSGNKLSAHYIKNLLRAVRKFNAKFVSKGSVRVRAFPKGDMMPEMVTQGSLDLRGFGLPIPVPFGAFKVHVEGTATIRFSSDAKVTEMEIGDWKINGKKCDLPALSGQDPSELSWQDKASLLAWAAKTLTC